MSQYLAGRMKCLASVLVISFVLGDASASKQALAAKKPLVTLSDVRAFDAHKHSNSPFDHALSIRGGHQYAPIAEKAYYALTGIHGIISALAPESVPSLLYFKRFNLEPDSLGSMLMEYAGSGLIACFYMAYLAFHSNMDAPTIIAHGTYPCAILNLRNLLKNNFSKKGFTKGIGTITTACTILLPFGIRTGNFGDAKVLAKVNIVFPALLGLVGCLDGSLGRKFLGLSNDMSGTTAAMFRWFCSSLVQWAIIAIALLSGKDAKTAVGLSALFFAASLTDNCYIRKANEPLNLPKEGDAIFIVLLAAIAYGLLG